MREPGNTPVPCQLGNVHDSELVTPLECGESEVREDREYLILFVGAGLPKVVVGLVS